jgi:hypothetical protein
MLRLEIVLKILDLVTTRLRGPTRCRNIVRMNVGLATAMLSRLRLGCGRGVRAFLPPATSLAFDRRRRRFGGSRAHALMRVAHDLAVNRFSFRPARLRGGPVARRRGTNRLDFHIAMRLGETRPVALQKRGPLSIGFIQQIAQSLIESRIPA